MYRPSAVDGRDWRIPHVKTGLVILASSVGRQGMVVKREGGYFARKNCHKQTQESRKHLNQRKKWKEKKL